MNSAPDSEIPIHPLPSKNEVSYWIDVLLHRYRWFIFFMTLSSVTVGFFYIKNLTPTYEVSLSMILSSATASSYDIQIPDFISQKIQYLEARNYSLVSQEALAIMKSRSMLERFIEEKAITKTVLKKCKDSFSQNKALSASQARKRISNSASTLLSTLSTKQAPNGLITLTIEWCDPVAAASWINDLVTMFNEFMRQKTKTDAMNRINYLEKAKLATSSIDTQILANEMIKSNLHTLTLADTKLDYVFQIVDSAIPPKIDDSIPQEGKIIFIAVLILSFIFSVTLSVLHNLRTDLINSLLPPDYENLTTTDV